MRHFQSMRAWFGRRVLAIVMLTIMALLAAGFIWAHKTVNVIVDGRQLTVKTFYSQPEKVLAQAGISLDPKDEYRISSPKLTNGTTIEVFRAVPVHITFQGKEQTIVTGKPTVGELAASLGIGSDNIVLDPGGQTRIQAGMHIKAVMLTEKIVERQVPEPFPVVHKPDPTMEKGMEEVVENGEEGRKLLKVKQVFADDRLKSEEVISETVVEPAKPRIVHVGTRDIVETSRGALRFRKVEWMEATAYLPTDGSAEGLTATGIPARYGIVAVDPDVVPLGTRVYVKGYGLALAADTGGAIVGHKIDLCMEDADEAYSFGRRMVKVYLLD